MKNVTEYLERTAAAFPDKTAVTDEYGSLTFGELRNNARRAACGLKIMRNTPVPVLMEKSSAAVTAFFAALYAGGFYVMLNPDLPDERLRRIFQRTEAPCIVTDTAHSELAARLGEQVKILLIDDLISNEENTDLLGEIASSSIDTDPVYANFTSGSTGEPKGMIISHRSVIDFIDVFTETFGINQTDIIGNQAPFDFDVSVKDIYSAVCTGAELVIIPKRLFSLPQELLDFMCEHRLTTLIWAVSALSLVCVFHGLDYKVPTTVRRVMFSGEVMPAKHLNAWLSHLPDAQFVNLYGPTEITCNCTYHVIDRGRDYSGGLPIGRAFPNERVFLLDGNCEVIEPRREGEICVSGTAVGIGYMGDFAATERSFIQNPCNKLYYERIYKTGDIGFYGEDGEIYYIGRRDFQIKHQGHRIELEEIERSVMKIDGVEDSCCVYDDRRKRIYCFYTGSTDSESIMASLSKELPQFMLPNRIIAANEGIPLTKNGKKDRKELLKRV